MGVPTLACPCAVCHSSDPHDKRTRPSLLVQYNGKNVVIDTTPDFRYQALRAGLTRLDALLFTHGHADHIMGLDDIRPFNLKQGGAVPIYGSAETLAVLKRVFAYIFEDVTTESTLPGVELHAVSGEFRFLARDFAGAGVASPNAVFGYRIGGAAYRPDFSTVPESSKRLLLGLDHLVLDALRYTPIRCIRDVEQSLKLVEELKPRKAWFTHICHDLGHEEANARLPENVRLSYDGSVLESKIS